MTRTTVLVGFLFFLQMHTHKHTIVLAHHVWHSPCHCGASQVVLEIQPNTRQMACSLQYDPLLSPLSCFAPSPRGDQMQLSVNQANSCSMRPYICQPQVTKGQGSGDTCSPHPSSAQVLPIQLPGAWRMWPRSQWSQSAQGPLFPTGGLNQHKSFQRSVEDRLLKAA